MAKHTTALNRYVLDSLANDIEDLDGILRMLNSDTDLGWKREWGGEFTRADVVTALSRLIREDLVRAMALDESSGALRELPRAAMPTSNYGDVYFAMTARGRMVHSGWDPTAEEPPTDADGA
jgi:hypothetical protein